MSSNYDEYLEVGTQKMMDYLSSVGADEGERTAVISAFSTVLSGNIADSEAVGRYEQVIYDASMKYLDGQVSKVMAASKASYEEYEKAIGQCKRIYDLIQLYQTKGWNHPSLSNRDIQKSEAILRQRQDSTSISSKMLAEDRKIDELIRLVEQNLEVKVCDEALRLLDDLANDLLTCKQKKVSVPALNNKDTKKVAKRVNATRKVAEQKEALHQRMYDVDQQIHNIVSLGRTTPDQWQMVIGYCQQQNTLLSECRKKQWPLPTIKYASPDSVSKQFKHYQAMDSLDKSIATSRDSLTKEKQYRTFFTNCEQQKTNVQTCQKNGWIIPELQVMDPIALANIVRAEKEQNDKAKKIKQKLIIAAICCVAILALVIFGMIKFREGKVKIPFDASYAVGADQKDIYNELESAGFENIIKKSDDSGWLDGGEVLSVTIDNQSEYSKNKYIEPTVSVIITYSSSGRVYVTDLLRDWSSTKYTDVEKALEDAGFTNIITEEVETSDKTKDQLTEGLSLNGQDYTNEHCYIPKNAPIVISYYALKIGIGTGSNEFIGQDYEDVVASLKESGFTNVQIEKINTGWAKGNTVIGVSVNNKDSFDSSDSFDPDVKIKIKYSSDDRTDITACMDKWDTKEYESLQSELKKLGFTNITVNIVETTTKSQNILVAGVAFNGERFTSGDCFVQKSAPIVIEYYKLKITIGNAGSDLTSNTEGYYSQVVTDLKNKGFTDIQVYRNNDLINGWLTKEGSIDSISIDGNSEFSNTDSFYYDVPVVIVVNTFKNKGCEDITQIAE